MMIEYKNLESGFNMRHCDEDGNVVVFIHAEYDDMDELINALFRAVNMVLCDEL